MKGIVRDPSSPLGAAVVDLPDPPDPGLVEVLVRMRLAPINPADRLVIAGRYAPPEGLPDVIGAEGMGIVEAIGGNVSALTPGMRVILLSRGNWSEWRCVPAADLIVVPDALPDAQAAILRINPATAAHLLDRLALSCGDWLIQNAAGSSVAGWVRRLAARRGVRTINVVRGTTPAASSEIFLNDGDDLADRVLEMAKSQPVGALDAVAGTATGRLAQCLAATGALLVYGHLSGEPCSIPSTLLTTKSLNVRGFTLRTAEAAEDPLRRARRYEELGALAEQEPEPIAGIYPFDQLETALAAAANKPGGRVLLSA
ncbi:zinc-dependent alcohol dehydrogenase family protein [Altererythrobacter sp. C41]|uniref:zinc-dependent alcohol dehydrogenase family protein n=1 Tax=Altererythrobacter sp. C41 TaxID=2806021 RepID=UPI001934586E|nr:zinc-dependent alcohol dehydrogenase family protein [Altererythrobacter sp. C41]MBM0171264.1 zinc-dependent alcohol dehydrogenase family protein [Altererythrobacter sp. C41]